MYRIMLVDDEEGILRALKRALAADKYKVELFTSSEGALKRAAEESFDLVISDYRMPKMDGVEFCSALGDIQPDIIRIILSGQSDFDAMINAIKSAKIYRFIGKPWHDLDLRVSVAQALSHRDAEQENLRLAEQVRTQQTQIDRQQQILDQLEADSPGISHVERAEDGSIIINDENL